MSSDDDFSLARRATANPGRAGLGNAAERLVLIDAKPSSHGLRQPLITLGYEVIAETADAGKAPALVDLLLPDAVLVIADSLDVAALVTLLRRLLDRHRAAVLLLSADMDPVDSARLKSLRPHGSIRLPVAPDVLDVAIQAALDAASAEPPSVQPAPAPQPVKSRRVRRIIGGAPSEPKVIRCARHTVKVPTEPGRSRERGRFQERFAIASARAARNGTRFAVGQIEMASRDDDAAHPRHIDITPEASQRLKLALRQTDAVELHLGGKLVFLAEEVDAKALDALGGRMLRTLSEPVNVDGHTRTPLPAIGMALWSSPEDDVEALLGAADKELLAVKGRTGKGWRIADCPDEPDFGESSSAPRRRRGLQVGAILQRTVGWVSLLTLGWVLASYSGIERAKTLAVQAHQFFLSLPPLR